MSYFEDFPLREYKFGRNDSLVVDVTREVVVNPRFEDPRFYMEYVVSEGDTPIILADRLYDDEQLDWTILHFNKMVDPYFDWPMDRNTLDQYITDKYDDPYGIHHNKSASTGNVVGDSHPDYDTVPVTNIEYEIEENDKKRNIRLVIPDEIGAYVEAHNQKVEVII